MRIEGVHVSFIAGTAGAPTLPAPGKREAERRSS